MYNNFYFQRERARSPNSLKMSEMGSFSQFEGQRSPAVQQKPKQRPLHVSKPTAMDEFCNDELCDNGLCNDGAG